MNFFNNLVQGSGPGVSAGYGAPMGGYLNHGQPTVIEEPHDFYWSNFEKGFKQPWRVMGESVGVFTKGVGGGLRETFDAIGPQYMIPIVVIGGGVTLMMILLLLKL